MKNLILILLAVICIPYINSQDIEKMETKNAIIRCDDFGMNHSVNMAFKAIIEKGYPVSVSTMFACPWYQEAVDILKENPEVSVGVHLTLNAEWKNYKWGPVIGKDAAPSLVDSNGYFFCSAKLFFNNNPKIDEIEKELRAQIERAFRSGIKIDYFDAHMRTAFSTPELRTLVYNLAKEYNVGVSTWYGEDMKELFMIPYDKKKEDWIDTLKTLKKNNDYVLLFHPGIDNQELQALEDLNLPEMTDVNKHRHAEYEFLLSKEFSKSIKENNIKLITYRDFIKGKEIILPDSISESY